MKKLCLIFCIIIFVFTSVIITSCKNEDSNINTTVDTSDETTVEVETMETTEATIEESTEETTGVVTEGTIDNVAEDNDAKKDDAKKDDAEEVEAPSSSDSDVDGDDDDYVSQNGWLYDDNLKKEENIFIYLTDCLGFSDAAACGIVANIAYETGWKFNADVGNPDYGAYGLIQWMGNRRKNLKSWCKENGKDYRSMQGQLDFMYWELVNDDPYGTFDHLVQVEDSAKGAYNAGWYFCYWYERPNRKDKASVWRGNEAKKYYKLFTQSELEGENDG